MSTNNNAPVDFSEKSLLYCLYAAVLISFFYNIGNVPLYDLDEGAFAEATREMFEREDYISTYLNGEPRYDKPILIYWLQALSVNYLGMNEFAFRLPSALASVLWVTLVVVFVRRFIDKKTAYIAGIITATCLSISMIGKAATADALLNCCLAGSMLFFFTYYKTRKRRFLYLFYLLASLGFLTKGPVALLIPAVVSLIFLLIKKEARLWLSIAFNGVGICIFLIVGLPWYAVQYLKEGQAFIDGFFLKHNVARFQGPLEGHVGSIFYFLPVILLASLPFTAVALKVFGRCRCIVKDDLQLFLLLWFVFVLVFFSFSGTKLPHYVNYGLTGLAILMAIYIGQLRSRFFAFLPVFIFFGVLLALPNIITVMLPAIDDAYYQASFAQYQDYFSLNYTWFFTFALLVVGFFVLDRHYSITSKLMISAIFMTFSVSAVLMPTMSAMLQSPVKEAAAIAKQAGVNSVMWRLNMPSFSVYLGQVVESRKPLVGEVVFTSPAYLVDLENYQMLYEKNGVALVKLLE